MKGRPYTVLIEGTVGTKLNIDLPNYFSNYQYVKVKVKDFYTPTDSFNYIELNCPLLCYDRIVTDPSIIPCLNLLRFLNGGKAKSFLVPYNRSISFSTICSFKQQVDPSFKILFEFIPINGNYN